MAQCYAESKPFDMHGAGGRLYCSGYGAAGEHHLKQYRSYSKYAAAASGAEMIVPIFLKQQQQQQQSSVRSSPSPLESAAAYSPSPSSFSAIEAASQSVDHRAPSADRSTASNSSIGSEEIPKPRRSGELLAAAATARKSDSSSKPAETDGTKASVPKPGSSSSSSSSSRPNSGEIATELDIDAAPFPSSTKVGNAARSSRIASRPAAASSHQSWPSSPANFRQVPRTRNLSEGSFSMIFPEEGHSHSRLYFTSPTRARSKEPIKTAEIQEVGGASGKLSAAESKQDHGAARNGGLRRGELAAEGGAAKARNYAGSLPGSLNKEREAPSARHSRNVSDGNWGVFNKGGSSFRSSPSTSTPKHQAAAAATSAAAPPVRPVKAQVDGINGGFVTGGSFARGATIPSGEKSPELAAPPTKVGQHPTISSDHQHKMTMNGKKISAESYGTGNIFLMGESMLLKKALSSKDAEEIKNIGNDQYKKGHFLEALSLYDRAISLSPGQAAYYSNKAAVLAALGRLFEAVQECQRAIVLDPGYSRAHQRLGTLFLRLGWTDEAKIHLQGNEGGELQRLESISLHLAKCHEARKLRDWIVVIKESDAAVVAGADSSVQAYALKAEALLNLSKVNEAERAIVCAQRYLKQKHAVDERVYFIAQAKIDLAQGRFDEALAAAEKASANEPFNAEVTGFDKKVRRLVKARATGNDLFKLGKFLDASAAYGEGLELDPENAILYCNRAACRSKLRLWEKAIEDCNAALNVQPSYTKALLRRAQCYAQLERWDSALDDYVALKSKLPGDVEVARALFETQIALKRSRGEDVYKVRFGGEIEEVYSPDQFKEAITSPGLAVVHFITRWSERCKQITPFIHIMSKRYPSVNFVKVDIEDHPFLAKTEGVGTVPTFKLYKNGHKVSEMLGPSHQKLEDAVQRHIL